MATRLRQGTVSGDSDAVVGAAMTNSGGIGIAKMISKQLHKAQDAEDAKATSAAAMHRGNTK